MTKHIEGFCNFEADDELTVNGKIFAKITENNDCLFIDFTFSEDRLFAGKKNDSNTDNIINAVWNTLKIAYHYI